MIKNTIKKNLIRAGLGSKPSFLIIGAQKAGTYGLFYTLKQHSLLSKSTKKEIHYFDNDNWYSKRGSQNEYFMNFPLSTQMKKGELLFEATPDYIYNPKSAQRIFQHNPKMKLIIILRNPVERAISAWTMFHHQLKTEEYKNVYDSRNFDEAIQEEFANFDSSNFYNDFRAYIKRGIYQWQLENYLKVFPLNQILIINSNHLLSNHEEQMNHILNFLDLPFEYLPQLILNKRVKHCDENFHKTLLELECFFKPYNHELNNYIQDAFGKKDFIDW